MQGATCAGRTVFSFWFLVFSWGCFGREKNQRDTIEGVMRAVNRYSAEGQNGVFARKKGLFGRVGAPHEKAINAPVSGWLRGAGIFP